MFFEHAKENKVRFVEFFCKQEDDKFIRIASKALFDSTIDGFISFIDKRIRFIQFKIVIPASINEKGEKTSYDVWCFVDNFHLSDEVTVEDWID
jgi:hypothetical protein